MVARNPYSSWSNPEIFCGEPIFVAQICVVRSSFLTGAFHAGNGWEWGNGIVINNYYGSFPHSLRLAPEIHYSHHYIPMIFPQKSKSSSLSSSSSSSSSISHAFPLMFREKSPGVSHGLSQELRPHGATLPRGSPRSPAEVAMGGWGSHAERRR